MSEQELKIGTRVRITHKPEHDAAYQHDAPAMRRAMNGKSGEIVERDVAHGLCYRVLPDDEPRGAWYEPDELTSLDTSEPGDVETRALAVFDKWEHATRTTRALTDPPLRIDRNAPDTKAIWQAVVRAVDASNPTVRDLRDELASIKAAHAEIAAALNRAKVPAGSLTLTERVDQAMRRLIYLEETRRDVERSESKARADRGHVEDELHRSRDALSVVKTRVDVVRVALDALDRALAGVPAVVKKERRDRVPLPEVDAEDLWTDYRTDAEIKGPLLVQRDRQVFLAGVKAGRRTPASLSEEDEREAYRFGQVTGIGFAAGKEAIRSAKKSRARLHDGDTGNAPREPTDPK